MRLRPFTAAAFAALIAMASGSSAQAPAGNLPPAATPGAAPAVSDPVSYVIGLSIGRQLTGDGFVSGDFRGQEFLEGVLEAMEGREPRLSEEQMRQVATQIDQVLERRFQEKQQQMQQQQAAAAAPNLEKSRQFLAANAKQPGVTQLPSGLQYSVLTAGTGASPTANDTVLVHYVGKTVDGKVFDSSRARGEPAKFVVSQVVKGWTEALQLMKVGGKWMLYIPPDLAYGERGVPMLGPDGQPVIGPNEALIFEVELLDIVR